MANTTDKIENTMSGVLDPSQSGTFHNLNESSSTLRPTRTITRQKTRIMRPGREDELDYSIAARLARNSRKPDAPLSDAEEIMGAYSPPRRILNPSKVTIPFTPPPNLLSPFTGIYRSGFVEQQNFGYLMTLGLKTILSIMSSTDPYMLEFAKKENINFIQIPLLMSGPRGMKLLPTSTIIDILLNKVSHPILMYDRHGTHRVGCITSLLRKMLDLWSMKALIDEYALSSNGDMKICDVDYICMLFEPGYGGSLLTSLGPRVSAFHKEEPRAKACDDCEKEAPVQLAKFGEGREKVAETVKNWRFPTTEELIKRD